VESEPDGSRRSRRCLAPAPQGVRRFDHDLSSQRHPGELERLTRLVDRDTGAAYAAIDWKFRVGDQVKIRLVNEMDSHPFHVHGAGRFLVLARDGVEEPNLIWKDTVLVRTAETVDILLDVTNPGRWMAHCHIAEHHESGMMFGFDVEP
jgi:FtsP/CotA-like multicopper oxidase with cupredoxin domain